METTGLLKSSGVSVIRPRHATDDELALFHERDYLEFVKRASQVGGISLDSGDTPAFMGCYEASALAVGASLTAADLVMSGKCSHAMNISGGLHHAHPGRHQHGREFAPGGPR